MHLSVKYVHLSFSLVIQDKEFSLYRREIYIGSQFQEFKESFVSFYLNISLLQGYISLCQ